MAEQHQMPPDMNIQVCYARPDSQLLIDLIMPDGATIEQAIRQSGILEQVPEISLAQNKVGIFGKIEQLDALLRDGDRIEIYRPLTVDPKQARRLRAQRR